MARKQAKSAKGPASITGFIYVEVEPGRDHEFLDQAKALPEVQQAHLITGAGDAFLIVKGDTTEDLHDWVRTELRRIRDIRSTNTFIASKHEIGA